MEAGTSESGTKPFRVLLTSLEDIDPDTFDWKAYCSTYKGRLTSVLLNRPSSLPSLTAGRALITRLCHIPNVILSQPNPSPHALKLARAAALRAIPLVKDSTWDQATYLKLVSQVDHTLHPEKIPGTDDAMDVDAGYGKKGTEAEGRPDAVWVEETRAKEEAENNRLSVELNGYLSNLIKESIRVSQAVQPWAMLTLAYIPCASRAVAQDRFAGRGAQGIPAGPRVLEWTSAPCRTGTRYYPGRTRVQRDWPCLGQCDQGRGVP